MDWYAILFSEGVDRWPLKMILSGCKQIGIEERDRDQGRHRRCKQTSAPR